MVNTCKNNIYVVDICDRYYYFTMGFRNVISLISNMVNTK